MYKPLNESNSKPFYSFYKKKSGKSNQNSPVLKGMSQLQSSETFNSYFQSVFSKKDVVKTAYKKVVNLIVVIPLGVEKLLRQLKTGKAPGSDQLRKKDPILDICLTSEILSVIFQCSLDIDKLQKIWKLANMVPIFMKGDRENPSNYRPVSLTCIACKILEHIVLSNICSCCANFLSNSQHSFRRGLSCTTQLVTTTDYIMKMVDDEIPVHAVVLDFFKAFDRVPHRFLMEKLFDTNIDMAIIKWIENFLIDRQQCVVVDGSSSEPLDVTSGVPQGSVLGPSLFLVYINDIADIFSTASIRLFADDALLYRPAACHDDMDAFQEELNVLEQWAKRWGMIFNLDKCHVVKFGAQALSNRIYFMNGKAIGCVESFK